MHLKFRDLFPLYGATRFPTNDHSSTFVNPRCSFSITQMAKFSSCFHLRIFIRLLYVIPVFRVLFCSLTERLDLLLGPLCLCSLVTVLIL